MFNVLMKGSASGVASKLALVWCYVIEKKENNMKEFVVGKILTIKEVKNKDGLIYGTCDGLIEGKIVAFPLLMPNTTYAYTTAKGYTNNLF